MPLPRHVVDSAAFARDGGRIEGRIEVAALALLTLDLAGSDGELAFVAQGAVSRDGELYLDLDVGGALLLRCQRCLQGLPFEVKLQRRFRLMEAGQIWPDDDLADDSVDPIAAERELDLVALVEQEVVLALPLAPRHETCPLPGPGEDKEGASPFAALAALKRGLH